MHVGSAGQPAAGGAPAGSPPYPGSPVADGLPPIVCGVDDGYAVPLCTMLASLAAAHATGASPRVIVLHHTLSAANRTLVGGYAERLGLDVQLRPVPAVPCGYPVSGWVSDAVYLRLWIAEVVDEPAVLYLDADVLVLGDLRALLATPLDRLPVAAVRDARNPLVGGGIALPGFAQLAIPAGREYFSSGVMLLDLQRCRRLRVFERARLFLARFPQHALLWDQDALNWAVDDRWRRLDRRWNTFALSPLVSRPGFVHDDGEPVMPLAQLLADEPTAAVLHFAGPDKPWRDDYPAGHLRELYRGFMGTLEPAVRR